MKLTKISLMACVAICGIHTAEAQPLEEAIKGVDVSGMLRYRYTDNRYDKRGFVDNDSANSSGRGSAAHQWRAEALFKTPAINAVSMNLGVRYHNAEQNVNHGKGITNADGTTTSFLGNGLGSGKDSSFGVSEFNAVITPDSTTTAIKVGKMILTTPLNDPLDDRGTGILATNADLNHWTFVAGAFDSWSLDDMFVGYALTPDDRSVDKPLYTLAAIGNYETNFGNIEAQVWGFKIDDLLDSGVFAQLGWHSDFYWLVGQYAFANLNNEADQPFAALYGGQIQDSADLYTIEAGTKFHRWNVPLSFKVGYIGNTKDSYAVSLDNEGSFQKVGQIWFENNATRVSISVSPFAEGQFMPLQDESNELSVFYGNLSYDILENLTLGIDYVNGTNKITRGLDNARYSGDIDFQEINPYFSYQHSKNLRVIAWYSMLTTDADKQIVLGSSDVSTWNPAENSDSEDRNRLRVEIKYSF